MRTSFQAFACSPPLAHLEHRGRRGCYSLGVEVLVHMCDVCPALLPQCYSMVHQPLDRRQGNDSVVLDRVRVARELTARLDGALGLVDR
eukprot:16000305-Heterocapsa_arctica.AAC.1